MHRMILVGLLGIGLTASAHAGATDYFTETAKDFGITPRGPVHRHYFPVKNTSDYPITLGAPRVSCGCVSAGVPRPNSPPANRPPWSPTWTPAASRRRTSSRR
jgi:hypothetical protein